MHQFFTAHTQKTEDGWFIAQCIEISNAFAQGKTEQEALENLKEVIELLTECNKEELQNKGFSSKTHELTLA